MLFWSQNQILNNSPFVFHRRNWVIWVNSSFTNTKNKGENTKKLVTHEVGFYQSWKTWLPLSWPATLNPCSSSCLMSASPFISHIQSAHYQLWTAAAGLCDGEGAGGLWVAVLAAGLFWHFIRQRDLSSERVLSDESVSLALCVWMWINY